MCSSDLAAAGDAGPIEVTDAWARMPPGGKNGAAFLTLTDRGAADRLIGASAPVAERTELHESIDDHGVMKMRPVEAVPLATGTPVTLMPGGKHIMLMGLKEPLAPGTTFPLTLRFEHAAPVTVQVTVGSVGGMSGLAT